MLLASQGTRLFYLRERKRWKKKVFTGLKNNGPTLKTKVKLFCLYCVCLFFGGEVGGGVCTNNEGFTTRQYTTSVTLLQYNTSVTRLQYNTSVSSCLLEHKAKQTWNIAHNTHADQLCRCMYFNCAVRTITHHMWPTLCTSPIGWVIYFMKRSDLVANLPLAKLDPKYMIQKAIIITNYSAIKVVSWHSLQLL